MVSGHQQGSVWARGYYLLCLQSCQTLHYLNDVLVHPNDVLVHPVDRLSKLRDILSELRGILSEQRHILCGTTQGNWCNVVKWLELLLG